MRRLAALLLAVAALAPSEVGAAASLGAWKIATASTQGPMVLYRMLNVDGAQFRAIRLIANHVVLRWHDGSQDPPASVTPIPADAGSAVDWANEGPAGVVALFNGGFKVGDKAGGSVVDGVVLSPLLPGDATIALNARGQWEMGVWGTTTFPTANFHPIAIRQNLPPLVQAGVVASSALAGEWGQWGSPLHAKPLVPRSGLGVDAQGNIVYVASIKGVLPAQLGAALVAAGVRFGMALDMNPYWPTLGASFVPLHHAGPLPVQIPYASHNPNMYFTGWERDFFVAVAQSAAHGCTWQSPGLHAPASARGPAQPQPLRLLCHSA